MTGGYGRERKEVRKETGLALAAFFPIFFSESLKLARLSLIYIYLLDSSFSKSCFITANCGDGGIGRDGVTK
jgi:hypothetical protein